jgi:hypothetical protein
MTALMVLMWIYVIGVVITAVVFGAAFRYADGQEYDMDSKQYKNWNDIKAQAEMRNLSLEGLAVLLALFWPWFLLKRG